MNNFKLKHNSVSSLLNTEPVKIEDHVVKIPVNENIPVSPQSINFKPLKPMPEFKDRINDRVPVDNTRAENIARNIAKHNRQNAMIEADRAKELERQMLEREFFTIPKLPQPIDTSAERNKIKYENQEAKRMEEEKMMEIFRQANADFNKKLEEMREREANKPIRVHRDYVTEPDVDDALQMVKRNSAAPFKLPHQSKAAPKQIVSSVGSLVNAESLNKAIDKTISDYESKFDRPEFKEFVEKEKAAFGPGDEFARMYAVVEPDGGYRLKDLSGEMEHIDIPEGMNYPESEKFLRDEAKKNLRKRDGYFSDKAFMSNY